MILAHVGGFTDVLRAWSWDPAVLAGLGLLAALYARGLKSRQGGRRRRRLLPWWRHLFFYGGLLVVLVALQSPVAALAHELSSAHMVQHLLLAMVAPPLLLLGAPVIPVLRGLPRSFRRRVVAPAARNRRVRGLLRGLSRPLAAWALYNGLFFAWHIPMFYGPALEHEAVHIAQHATFFGTGVLFWWNVVEPVPLRARLSHPMRILYLFLATIPCSALGALLTLSPTPWYAFYEQAAQSWGLTALEDQRIGGLIMWVPGGLLYLLAVSAVFFSMPDVDEGRWGEQRA